MGKLIVTIIETSRLADLNVGAQGKPVKALSPNCRGGSFTGRRQTAATPHAPPSERAAANRTEPTEAPPPHSREKLTVLAAGSEHPDGAGIGAYHVPRFSPGFVQVSGSASGPALPASAAATGLQDKRKGSASGDAVVQCDTRSCGADSEPPPRLVRSVVNLGRCSLPRRRRQRLQPAISGITLGNTVVQEDQSKTPISGGSAGNQPHRSHSKRLFLPFSSSIPIDPTRNAGPTTSATSKETSTGTRALFHGAFFASGPLSASAPAGQFRSLRRRFRPAYPCFGGCFYASFSRGAIAFVPVVCVAVVAVPRRLGGSEWSRVFSSGASRAG